LEGFGHSIQIVGATVSKPPHASTEVRPDRVARRGIDQQHPEELGMVHEPIDEPLYRFPEILSYRQPAFGLYLDHGPVLTLDA
jgi:hypothetical protein